MSKWRPIETAPKDGSPILVYRPSVHFKIGISSWCQTGKGVWYWAQWSNATQQWNLNNPPTHWMPLPDPPAVSQEPAK